MPIGDDRLHVFVAESVSAKDFYQRDWEGRAVEEVVRLLDGQVNYRIIISTKFLLRGIAEFYQQGCTVFHLSAHGNEKGIRLADTTNIDWKTLAANFDPGKNRKVASQRRWSLVMSSCCGGTSAVARAFASKNYKPDVIFGSEATEDDDLLTFPTACIAWPILYSELQQNGVSKAVFQDAVGKMNLILPHRFVYRRWDDRTGSYRRYPAKAEAATKRGK